MNQSVLRQLVQVPRCVNHRDFEAILNGKCANVCRLAGLDDSDLMIGYTRAKAVARFESMFGKSNLTVWRLCQLTDQNLIKVMLGKKPVHQTGSMLKPVLRIVR